MFYFDRLDLSYVFGFNKAEIVLYYMSNVSYWAFRVLCAHLPCEHFLFVYILKQKQTKSSRISWKNFLDFEIILENLYIDLKVSCLNQSEAYLYLFSSNNSQMFLSNTVLGRMIRE